MPTEAQAAQAPASNGAPASLDEALLAFQRDVPTLIKDAEADVQKKDGSRAYTYKYLTLQALLHGVRPKLTELGLVWRTRPGVDENGRATLSYRMTHVPSSESDEGTMPLIVGGTMQTYGSSLSFARRYALIAYLNLAPDVDEDAATGPVKGAGAGAKKLTKAKATELVNAAQAAGINGDRLRLGATHVFGEDVGDCATKAKAITAMQKLDTAQADRLFSRIAALQEETNA